MKTVGRRNPNGDPLADQGRLARTVAALRGDEALAPVGVYRFRSFDEADEWMSTTMRRMRERRNQATSSVSVGR